MDMDTVPIPLADAAPKMPDDAPTAPAVRPIYLFALAVVLIAWYFVGKFQ